MRICDIEGCDRKHYGKGFCSRHYFQMRRHGKIFKRTRIDLNEIVIGNDIAEIVLYDKNQKEKARTIIDVEDVEKIKNYKWCFKQGYVKTHIKENLMGIQNIIMNFKSNRKKVIDHKDRNPLNNRKSNYRICSAGENVRNSGKHKHNKSGFKGVCKNKAGRWRAEIMINGKRFCLGNFKYKIEAAKNYNDAAKKHFGEFAYLNEI